MVVVTLGPAGTYSHRAARSLDDDVRFAASIREVVDAVADGAAERGVVPVENSIEGSVTQSLDTLADADVAVVHEIVTPIRHALLARDEGFDVVASHPQALAQCRDYLTAAHPNATTEAVASTTKGVEQARADPRTAAIAHPDAAGDGVEVIAEDVQDRASNATRFLVVAPPDARSAAGGKSSVVIYPDANHPGLLLSLLEPFADRDINLSRIESRPSGEHLGDYVFHLDFEAGRDDERVDGALAELERRVASGWVRWLGSYDTTHMAT